MTKKKVYDYIIDGSNVLHESKSGMRENLI